MRKHSYIFLSMLLAASISLAALFIVVVGVPVFAQDTTVADSVEVLPPDEYGFGGDFSVDEYGECPSQEFLCEYWPPIISQMVGIPLDDMTPGHWCYGSDCFKMNAAEEGTVVAADDEGPFPRTWMTWNTGNLLNLSCNIKNINHNKYFERVGLEIPDQLHCSTLITTNENYLLWFFASNPEVGCFAWAECIQPR